MANPEALVRSASALRGVACDAVASADTLRETAEHIARLLEPALAAVVDQRLNTDPGGALHAIIDEVIAAHAGCRCHGPEGDDPDAPLPADGAPAADPQVLSKLEELRQLLRS